MTPAMRTSSDTTGASPRTAPSTGRRAFLRTAAFGAAAVGGVAAVGSQLFGQQIAWWRRRVENYTAAYSYAWLPAEERILRHFDYLRLDRKDVRRFVRDFERQYGAATLRNREANRLLYSKFLMSTDFFRNGADESTPVRYVAFHDPYTAPCWVPFTVAA
jgi:hypothetical protein